MTCNDASTDIEQEQREILMHMKRDGALQSFTIAKKRGDDPWAKATEGGRVENRLPTFPILHPSDARKLHRLSEPQRASTWLQMSFVACEGSYLDFNEIYTRYRRLVESDSCGDKSKLRGKRRKRKAKGTKKRASEPSHQTEKPQEAPSDEQADGKQSPEKQPVEKQPLEQQPAQPQCSPESREQEQPAKNTLAEGMARCEEFFQILHDTVHGIRVYCRFGRVHSWSHAHFQKCSRILVLGICTRIEELTFASISRQQNLAQYKQLEKKGQLVYPEGNPDRRSTFAKKMAEDPLLMLPSDVQSFWMKWKMRDSAYYDGKWSEDSAFPGVSIHENRLPERPVAAKAGPATRSAESDQASSVKPEPTQDVEANPDQQQSPPKGKSKQRSEDTGPTDSCRPAAAAIPQQDTSIVAIITGLKRKRSLGDPSRKPTTPASTQRSLCKGCGKKKATPEDAEICQKGCCSAKKISGDVTRAVDSQETEELVQKLGELGIKSDRLHSQLEANAESGEAKKRADSSDVSEAVASVAEVSRSLLKVTEELEVEIQADCLLSKLRRWDRWP